MGTYFCRTVRIVNAYIKKHLSMKSVDLGLTSFQCAVINYINMVSEENKLVFQKDLEEVFKASKSSMSDLLLSLESKGFIERNTLKNGDSRKKSITLTKEGKRICSMTDEYLKEAEDFFLSSLSEEDKEKLFEIFGKFNERMEKQI